MSRRNQAVCGAAPTGTAVLHRRRSRPLARRYRWAGRLRDAYRSGLSQFYSRHLRTLTPANHTTFCIDPWNQAGWRLSAWAETISLGGDYQPGHPLVNILFSAGTATAAHPTTGEQSKAQFYLTNE